MTAVTLTTAQPLTAGQRSQLLKKLQELYGEPELNEVVDAQVIGGVRLQIGSTLYDGTVSTKLEQLYDLAVGAPSS
ncbi:MAG: hypothetical protein COU69_02230 [Candidatus Pacebacteria bacterium CG10_big_fil_rev_8_21_14_0_10_56_10]|nr:MAG: hypothetical protein COU69_02230 [Candidatus Pacebacteria bacterium CG10_big_fil_rev_8_21_14_0_10_56_10]